MSLKEFKRVLEQVSLNSNSSEEQYFTENPPTKEFSIERDGELVHYGVWNTQENDEFMVIFKTPDGKYHLRYKSYYDKVLVRELYQLIEVK